MIGKLVKRIILGQSAEALGLDIGSGYIKMAYISHKDSVPMLLGTAIRAIPAEIMQNEEIIDMEALAELLRSMTAQFPQARKNAVFGIGGRMVYSREVILPDLSPKEMVEAIKWDMDSYVPYAADSYYYDYTVVEKVSGEKGTEAKVLIVSALKERVNRFIQLAEAAGLQIGAIDFEALAVQRTFPTSLNGIVVDIGKNVCQIMILQKGSPVVVRTIPLGGHQVTQTMMQHMAVDYVTAEAVKVKGRNLLPSLTAKGPTEELHSQIQYVVEDLAREIRRTFEYHQMQHKEMIAEQVFLTGGGALLKGLAEHLAAQIELPVLLNNPFEAVRISKKLDRSSLYAAAPQFTVAIGLALQEG
ncbi:MAG: type IV pilus assembly protein PilM [Sporomusaceae bacterium]|nr:type IV pilus assembly protein PilM [Sporomusaceae bacterium]